MTVPRDRTATNPTRVRGQVMAILLRAWCQVSDPGKVDRPIPPDTPRVKRRSGPQANGGERRRDEAYSENDREPDHPHGHLDWTAAGSLVEGHYARQRPGLDERRG